MPAVTCAGAAISVWTVGRSPSSDQQKVWYYLEILEPPAPHTALYSAPAPYTGILTGILVFALYPVCIMGHSAFLAYQAQMPVKMAMKLCAATGVRDNLVRGLFRRGKFRKGKIWPPLQIPCFSKPYLPVIMEAVRKLYMNFTGAEVTSFMWWRPK